jgi:hypothetical protein
MSRNGWGQRVCAVSVLALLASCGGPVTVVDGGAEDARATPPCLSDAECIDARYCNGSERCAPDDANADAHGCVHVSPPCMESQRCIEEESRCVTQCAIEPDADGDGVDAIECHGADCDDADRNRFPLNPEVCDDTSHDEDCDLATFGHRDEDHDQMDDAVCCNVTAAGLANCGGDCSDQRPDIRLGFAEVCDGFDNDCDGTIDERVSRSGARDEDFDLHGATPTDPPTAAVTFCAGEPGFSTVTDDCADTTPSVHGAQVEICDMADNDCDGLSDEEQGVAAWYPDDDGDGFGDADADRVRVSCTAIAGFVLRPGDCDDASVARSPAQHETCNALDDDCDGRADYVISPGDTEDDDGDGHADRRCGGDDCNDADSTIHPGAVELSDARDNDCNGAIDDAPGSVRWYVDADLDGYGAQSDLGIESSTVVPGRITRAGDCDDGRGAIHPGAADFCDGVDDDCDARLDEGATPIAFFADVDGDGWGGTDLASIVIACAPPASAAARLGDCADDDDAVHPGALEVCDAVDQDCDVRVDESSMISWYVDLDGDGAGAGEGVASCTPISGRAPMDGDCDDADPLRSPGRAEACNAVDDDCDGTVDDGASATCPAPHTTSAMCTLGACTSACVVGFSDCDGDDTTGCETDTAHTPDSCGACFAPCAVSDSCGRTTPGVCDVAPMTGLWAGDLMFFASRATGGVAAWGDGRSSRLSTAFPDEQPSPILATFANASDVAAFNGGACALDVSGRVSCWGTGSYGSSSAPALVPLRTAATAICASSAHACAVLADHTVWCRGSNAFGELGNGGLTSGPAPTQSVDAAGPITDAIDVACSVWVTCVLRERATGDRYVSCSGWNGEGELGNGTVDTTMHPRMTDVAGLPPDLVALSRGASYGATCVRDVAGRAYCWGYNQYGVLGLGPLGPSSQPLPTTPPGLESGVLDIVFVPASAYGACAIRASAGGGRDALCWGSSAGLTPVDWLGDGTAGPEVTVFVPTLLGPPGSPVRDALAIARANGTACVLRASGGIWCAGSDTEGELGDGAATGTASASLVRVSGLP